MKISISILLLAITLPVASFAATSLTNQPGSGTVDFLAVGRPSMLKIHGTGGGPEAKLQLDGAKLKGKITMDLNKLDTGISLRTEHMKEKYLDVKAYPKSILSLTDAAVDGDFSKTLSNGGEKTFRGKLSLHGKEKGVEGTYTAHDGVVKAKFPLTISDYGIDIPKYLGITVADTVNVEVEIPLQKK